MKRFYMYKKPVYAEFIENPTIVYGYHAPDGQCPFDDPIFRGAMVYMAGVEHWTASGGDVEKGPDYTNIWIDADGTRFTTDDPYVREYCAQALLDDNDALFQMDIEEIECKPEEVVNGMIISKTLSDSIWQRGEETKTFAMCTPYFATMYYELEYNNRGMMCWSRIAKG